jgi:hypothetical protein
MSQKCAKFKTSLMNISVSPTPLAKIGIPIYAQHSGGPSQASWLAFGMKFELTFTGSDEQHSADADEYVSIVVQP